MWGSSIVGCGLPRGCHASGHGGETCRVGRSPRVATLVFHLEPVADDAGLLATAG